NERDGCADAHTSRTQIEQIDVTTEVSAKTSAGHDRRAEGRIERGIGRDGAGDGAGVEHPSTWPRRRLPRGRGGGHHCRGDDQRRRTLSASTMFPSTTHYFALALRRSAQYLRMRS